MRSDAMPHTTLSSSHVALLWRLCRTRHNRHYSAYRIMPNLVASAGEALAW